jgi:hypothetical protein
MRSKAFCTLFAPVLVDFNPKETEPNRNFNDLILELSIRLSLISKVRIELIDSVRNRIIARRIREQKIN